MGASMTRQWEPLAETGFVYGQGSAVQALNATLVGISRTNIPVLIMGESGTGKEVYARLIHRLSRKSEALLKKISCITLDPGQLMSQMRESLRPRLEHLQTGTFLFDGVDELDLSCQRVLLSLLPDGEANNGSEDSSARLISCTCRNLGNEVEGGRFRRELYFRINGVSLRLPPLRERKEDIPTLIQYFLTKHSRELNGKIPALNSEAMELLFSYEWPGNIRELENVAKKMVALGDAQLALGDLSSERPNAQRGIDGQRISPLKVAARIASRRIERELILKALERTHWNRKRAAQELEISYKSLLYKIKQTGVQGSDSEE